MLWLYKCLVIGNATNVGIVGPMSCQKGRRCVRGDSLRTDVIIEIGRTSTVNPRYITSSGESRTITNGCSVLKLGADDVGRGGSGVIGSNNCCKSLLVKKQV